MTPFPLLASLGPVTRFLPLASSCEGFQVSSGVLVSFSWSSLLSYYTSGLGLLFLLCVRYFTDPIFRCKLNSDSKAPQETSLLWAPSVRRPVPWAPISLGFFFLLTLLFLRFVTWRTSSANRRWCGSCSWLLTQSTNLRLKASLDYPSPVLASPYVLQLSPVLGPIQKFCKKLRWKLFLAVF